jgi:AcrR family transcriptional regulator
MQQIVDAAGVTKGAMYHYFARRMTALRHLRAPAHPAGRPSAAIVATRDSTAQKLAPRAIGVIETSIEFLAEGHRVLPLGTYAACRETARGEAPSPCFTTTSSRALVEAGWRGLYH